MSGNASLVEQRSLRVGDLLHGYCGGRFGRDYYSYQLKRVEAIGADWVVVRLENGEPWCWCCEPGETPNDLLEWVG